LQSMEDDESGKAGLSLSFVVVVVEGSRMNI
jgi:hypothetical protein